MTLEQFLIALNNHFNEWNEANGFEDAQHEVCDLIKNVLHTVETEDVQAAIELINRTLTSEE